MLNSRSARTPALTPRHAPTRARCRASLTTTLNPCSGAGDSEAADDLATRSQVLGCTDAPDLNAPRWR